MSRWSDETWIVILIVASAIGVGLLIISEYVPGWIH